MKHAFTRTLLGICLALAAGLTGAHHSASAYDAEKPVVVTGTVEQFRWANPHCWLYVNVPDGKGGTDRWSLEGGSVSVLARNGWKSGSLLPGMKVKVLVQPNRDGSSGGGFLTVTLDNGTVYAIGTI